MDDEKTQRTIEFIIDNWAQFTADIQELKEVYIEAEKRAGKHEDRMGKLERGFVGLYGFMDETSKIVKETTENVNQLTSDVKELRKAQKETNERLDAVITVFEKYLDNQNGKSK
jgi:uncharacterized coiled-coil DUF342 family protein